MNDTEWHDAIARWEVPDDDVVSVQVLGREVAFYAVGDEVFATGNICSHGHARLCEGFLDGYEIECPRHQGKFDVRTGQATCAPAVEPIKVYPVKIDGERVFIALG